MFDIGWTEMLTLAVLAIVVVGPKDLPKFLRAVGNVVRSVRSVANDFKQNFDQLANEAELQDITDKLNASGNIPVDNNGAPLDEKRRQQWEDEAYFEPKPEAETSDIPQASSNDDATSSAQERPSIKVSGKTPNDDT
ncbi:MAG: twin-arginine translocase subunit TatB [Kordiimonas sp.]|nr:twin-arginine translocase subunit TatB [Kordiimonas sp.]|tara:strand:- start:2401 stop:2811 length:411 start_codon:yes stop_codon:yes gene_type:complete